MQIAHFFAVEYVSRVFDTYAEIQAFEAECGAGMGEVMEIWQTEDGDVFYSAAEAEQHARDNTASSFDWDGFNMKGVELMGSFA